MLPKKIAAQHECSMRCAVPGFGEGVVGLPR